MVQIVSILNGLSQLAIALLSFYVLFSFYKKYKQIKLIGWILGLNGIFYFTFSFLNISWAFNFLAPNTLDFILVHTIITVISSILLLYVVYKITSNKNLIYLFLIFLVSLFSITYGINSFFLITLMLTYFLIIIIFLNLIIFTNYLSAGYFGISYAIISLAFLFIYLWSKLSYQLWWFIPHTLNLLILLFIFSGIKKLGVDKPPKRKMHNHPILSIILLYLKYIMFIVSISSFIFLSTVSIHEVGHVFIAKYYGCEDTKAIIYDWGNYPHAEIKCRNSYNDTIITLGGILSTFIVIIIFLLSGNEFILRMTSLILGFSLLVSYDDFVALRISDNIITVIMLFSYIIILVSIVRLSTYYLSQEDIFKEGVKKSLNKLKKFKHGKKQD